jgi:hypothetical protein
VSRKTNGKDAQQRCTDVIEHRRLFEDPRQARQVERMARQGGVQSFVGLGEPAAGRGLRWSILRAMSASYLGVGSVADSAQPARGGAALLCVVRALPPNPKAASTMPAFQVRNARARRVHRLNWPRPQLRANMC